MKLWPCWQWPLISSRWVAFARPAPSLPSSRPAVPSEELRSSLDHAGIPYHDAGERVVLDDQGFVLGGVTAITFLAESDGYRFLHHRVGEVARQPIELAGVEVQKLQADPHPALAWSGRNFVVLFERGSSQTPRWLADLATATIEAAQTMTRR
jgi:hypothetical protein